MYNLTTAYHRWLIKCYTDSWSQKFMENFYSQIQNWTQTSATVSCTKCIHYRAPSSLKLHKADINHPKDSNFVLSYSSASVCVCVLVQSCTLMVIGSIASLLKRNIKKSLLLNIFLEVIFFWHKHNHPLNCDYFLETEAHTEVLSQNACSLK